MVYRPRPAPPRFSFPAPWCKCNPGPRPVHVAFGLALHQIIGLPPALFGDLATNLLVSFSMPPAPAVEPAPQALWSSTK